MSVISDFEEQSQDGLQDGRGGLEASRVADNELQASRLADNELEASRVADDELEASRVAGDGPEPSRVVDEGLEALRVADDGPEASRVVDDGLDFDYLLISCQKMKLTGISPWWWTVGRTTYRTLSRGGGLFLACQPEQLVKNPAVELEGPFVAMPAQEEAPSFGDVDGESQRNCQAPPFRGGAVF